MPSFFSYLTKEQQKVFRGIPFWTAGNFNSFMKDNEKAIENAETDPAWFDQVITKLAEKTYNNAHLCATKPKGWSLQGGYPRAFSRELCEDLLHLMLAVKKAIAHEAKVQMIQAAAKGLVKYEDVKTKFPFICTWEPKGYHVKLQLWRDINPETLQPIVIDGSRYYIKTYVWLDKKAWYSEDEIKAACSEIIKKERDFIQQRLERTDKLDAIINSAITGGFVL
jgi:Asp-tRNA(Asn)/Glu-tRNA(Gln) amidotransferase B subunit